MLLVISYPIVVAVSAVTIPPIYGKMAVPVSEYLEKKLPEMGKRIKRYSANAQAIDL
jgi:hypothetical protein